MKAVTLQDEARKEFKSIGYKTLFKVYHHKKIGTPGKNNLSLSRHVHKDPAFPYLLLLLFLLLLPLSFTAVGIHTYCITIPGFICSGDLNRI